MKHLFYFIISIIFTCNAVAQTSIWTGNSEIWNEGDGSKQNPFLIKTASNLAYLSQFLEIDNSDFFYFEVKIDIDLNDIEWTPIGTKETPFKGFIEGNNHTVSNLKIHNQNSEYTGLFGYAINSTFSTLFVSDAIIVGEEFVGAICAFADNCQIKECTLQGKISSDTENCHIGGICGYANDGKIINCKSLGEVNTSGMQCEVGGIVGTSSGEIRKCENYMTMTGTEMSRYTGASYIGGICGLMNDNLISKCNNYGIINSSSSKYYMACLGGIAGRAESNSIISGCYNNGNIQSDKFNSGNTGGICGWSLGCIMGSMNSGNLNTSFPDSHLGYSHSVGGICGSGSNGKHGLAVIACYNTGDINCSGNQSNKAGGISGNSYSGDFYACYNIGEITGRYNGGICGYQYNIGKIYTGLWVEGKSSYLEGNRKSSIGKSTNEELRASSDIRNTAISGWNGKNTEINCNFYFKIKEDANDGYPILISQPIVKTKEATEITNNSAVLNADIEIGDELVISQGFKYKKTVDVNFSDIESFGEEISIPIECNSSTNYTFLAYVITENGTYLGEELSFSTSADTGTNITETKNDYFYYLSQDNNYLVINSTFLIKSISIYNISGSQIYVNNLMQDEYKINMSTFPKGVFIVNLNGGLYNRTFKVQNK